MEKEKKLQKIFEKDCILIPRQAMGKLSDNDILGPIFSILPLFYTKNREDSIILTLNEMFEHLFFTDNFLLKNIININNTHLYFIQILRNDTFKITIQRENMDKFLKEVNKLKYVVIKKGHGTYLADKRLSFGATGLLKFFYHLFDIFDRKQIKKGIEYQVIIVSNCVITAKEVKNYLELSNEKIVMNYAGEVK